MGNLVLNSLEIHNFRAFHELKIERLGRVNLIVGKNNVGKTSLLEAVQFYAHEIPCTFASSQGLSGERLIELWDNIALTKLEADVLAVLRLLAPGLSNLNFVSTPLSGGERIPVVKVADNNELFPLYSLGDGMLRALGISLALVNAKDGILLIDAFENGLYYTVQPDLWRLIFRVASRLNVQVFATTHSWDCIEAFQQASRSIQEVEGLLIRLESKKSGIVATLYNARQLSIATREQIEVR